MTPVEELLELLGEAFDLDTPTSSGTLKSSVHERLEELVSAGPPHWGGGGSLTQVAKQGSEILEFYYRPHLFPDMSASLRLGHQLQFDLLPRSLPPNAPVRLAAVLESYCHLSGDLLGWRQEEEGFLLWIADISGHGVRAGLAAAVIRFLIDRIPPGLSPDAFAEALNEEMLAARNHADRSPLFASAVIARIEDTGDVVYASAGHPPAMLRTSKDKVVELPATGVPIGLLPHQSYALGSFRLAPGDSLLLFSDGVIEATDGQGREFGRGRLKRLLAESAGLPIDIARAIYDDVTDFKDSDSFEDDLTFLVAQTRGS